MGGSDSIIGTGEYLLRVATVLLARVRTGCHVELRRVVDEVVDRYYLVVTGSVFERI